MYTNMLIDSSKRLWIKQSSRRGSRWKLHSGNNDDVIRFDNSDFLLNRMGVLIRVINGIETIIDLKFKVKRMVITSTKYRILALTITGDVIAVTILPDNSVDIGDPIASNIKRINSDNLITYSGDIIVNSLSDQPKLIEGVNAISIRDNLLIDNNGRLSEIITEDEVVIRPIKTPYSIVDSCRIGSKILLLANSSRYNSEVDAWIKDKNQSYRLSLKSGHDINCYRLIELTDGDPLIEDVHGNFYSINVKNYTLTHVRI